MTPKSPNWLPTWSSKMIPSWLYRQHFVKFSLNRHYNEKIRKIEVLRMQVRPYCGSSFSSLHLHQGWADFSRVRADSNFLKAVIPKCLVGQPVDRDRRNAYPGPTPLVGLQHREKIRSSPYFEKVCPSLC
ncbi:hypothetical protein TNCV_469661 [Trichonephila clavipes]|nr:hypothetical protein TNCV_469661 [Trichonephila clavipes]